MTSLGLARRKIILLTLAVLLISVGSGCWSTETPAAPMEATEEVRMQATPSVAPTIAVASLPTASVVPTATPMATPEPSLPGSAPAATVSAYPASEEQETTEPVWSYRVVEIYPHDDSAFTQGLVVDNEAGLLLEGTGRDSSLRRVELETGAVRQKVALPDEYFGEGITLKDGKIYQLTWRAQRGFVYDAQTLEQVGEFAYPHEGWGITHDGRHLIVSDGSEIIRFWNPETFDEVRRIEVRGASGPLTLLNELEYVNGEIWANVWHTDLIARISPENGRILGWIDMSGLLDPGLVSDREAVLNGIAYDREAGRLYVTGKLWPHLFEVELQIPADK